MSECKLQSNFKDNQGGLHNVYANDESEHLVGLIALQNNAGPIAETGALLLGVTAAVPLMEPPTPPAPAPASPLAAYRSAPPTPVDPAPAAPPQAAPAASVKPRCVHGEREYVSKVGPKGPWQAWMCPAAKDDPTKCEPQWIR